MLEGKEIGRLKRRKQRLSIRDTGHVYKKDAGEPWKVWIVLDDVGLKRVGYVRQILHEDGWQSCEGGT